MMSRVPIASALASLALAGLVAAQGGDLAHYAIPGHGNLSLRVPPGWRVATKSTVQPASVYLDVRPERANGFSLQVTAVWLDASKLAKVDPASMKQAAARAAEGLLGQSVEKTAPIQEITGPKARGFYYSLTDRAPAPGEFRYLTQGTVLSGEVMLAFTFLHHENPSAERETALKMLAETATWP